MNKSFIIRNKNVIGMDVQRVYTSTPVGIIQPFASNTNIPRGYLLCNGASYKVADYPDLYAVIGNTYGGDTENFNVPNLVDKFIQGSTTSGTEKEAGLPNITGRFYHDTNVTSSLSGAFFSYTRGNSQNLKNDDGVKSSGYVSFDASKSNAIYGNSNTVQPPALTMVYIIKAFHTNEGVDNGVSDDVVEYVNDSLVNKADKSYVDDNFATMDKVGTTQTIGFKTNLLNQCYGYYTIKNNKVSVHMKFVLSRALGDWEILTNTNLLAPSSAVTKNANGKTGSPNSVYISTEGTMQQGGGGGMSAGTYEFDFEYTTA